VCIKQTISCIKVCIIPIRVREMSHMVLIIIESRPAVLYNPNEKYSRISYVMGFGR